MTIDVKTPDSPGWWLARLARKLEAGQPRLQALADRYEGNGPLPDGAANCRDTYKAFQRKARTNFAELVVEATRRRMSVAGFRTAAAGDENGDREARRIWDANGLDVEAADVHSDMLALSDAYVIVGGPDEETGVPVITGEDPRQVVTIHDPVRQRVVRAALKVFFDEDEGVEYAYLYLPGRRFVAHRVWSRRPATIPAVRFSPATWDWDPERGGVDGEEMPHDRVPVVRFRNRRGVGEFEPHLDLLDRIDQQVLQQLVIATMQAFRQRAVKGDLPETDENGDPIDYDGLFVADPGALWQLPEGVDLWESAQVDLRPVLDAIKSHVNHLAAVTSTPLHLFSPDAAATGSAEGAALLREELVAKVVDRIARASEAWKDVMALAFLSSPDEVRFGPGEGDERADRAQRTELEPLWARPERRSLAERADAASKAGDVPWRTRMTDIWEFPPEQVDRMEAERAADALLAATLVPESTGGG